MENKPFVEFTSFKYANLKPIVMKNIYLFSGILLLAIVYTSCEKVLASPATSTKDSITVFCSQELSTLTNKWATEYFNSNPETRIKVVTLNESGSAVSYSGGALSFVTQKDYTSNGNDELWKVLVGRDVMVPVINSNNPFITSLFEKGITADELSMVFTDPSIVPWGMILGNKQNNAVTTYILDNQEVRLNLAKFLNTDAVSLSAQAKKSGSELVSAVQKDPYAIGFCRLSDILDSKTQQIAENISLIPIDRNANGKVDFSENIYQDLGTFSRGVWIGKYPKALYSSIYSVSATKPSKEKEVAFLKWVLTDGQQFVAPSGYTDLAVNERKSKADDLTITQIDLLANNTESSNLKMILLILGITVVASFGIDAVLRYRKNLNLTGFTNPTGLRPDRLDVPAGLYYDKSHTWAFMEKDGMVKIGVDDFLQHVTGTITQIKMKKAGEKISKGDQILSLIHKGKQLNIYAPVSGTIREFNEFLKSDSTLVNTSPYSEGWVYVIEPTNWLRDIQFLSMAEKYKIWLKEESSRLKDFIAEFIKPGTTEYAHVILQDGGELKDQVLADLAPEIWEEFQTNFLDNAK